ncbi:hypothetical protein J3A83DRAFT_4357184 [Scleroderma citrinum]
MAPRRKCPTCGSKHWRKDFSSGMITCIEGHVLQSYRTESGDAEDYGMHTMKKRTLKSTREKKGNVSRADPKLYHGERARFHYFQCLQVLFRKQVAALITLWNLPPEFEVFCHWSARTSHQSPDHLQRFHRHFGDKSDADAELDALLQENSEVSSTNEDSSEEETPRIKKRHIKRSSLVDRYNRPENTISVLVLACWTIRVPVVYMDFINAIEDHSIPYLDHVRLLSPSLTRHLTKHAVQALSPHHAPKASSLHRLASRFANLLYSNFGVIIPPLNVAPVLWRVLLALLYLLTKQLGHVLSLPTFLHHSITSSLCEGDNIERYCHDNVPSEVALVCTAIIVLKLVYGLDGKFRLPTEPEEAACALPDVDEFLASVKQAHDAKPFVNNHPFSAQIPMYVRSVGDLDDKTLDEYLDFCEKVLVESQENDHRILDNYFSLTNQHRRSAVGNGLMTHLLTSIKVNHDKPGTLRPGESYTIYHSGDILGNIVPDLDMLIERASRWAGVSGDYLCGVVERYECRLVRWWHTEQRCDGEMPREQ